MKIIAASVVILSEAKNLKAGKSGIKNKKGEQQIEHTK